MATVAHCLYCFETLAAKLEDRTSMALSAIETSWPDYPKGSDDGDSDSEANADADADTNGGDILQIPTPSFSSTSASSGTSSSQTSSLRSPTPITPITPPSSTGTSAPPSRPATSAPEPPYYPIGHSRSPRSAQSSALTSTPLFVTWNILSPPLQSRQLRGCIGTFEAQPLDTGLSTYAIAAAHQDNRFNPIASREMPALEVAVTLLTNFETCADPLDWELGVHGIKISFYHHHKRYSATYLPDVAVEQRWNKDETLNSLVRKAGWKGRSWKDAADLTVVRYQGRKESVDYEEYKRWRDWVTARK